jgi:hypothetical protein
MRMPPAASRSHATPDSVLDRASSIEELALCNDLCSGGINANPVDAHHGGATNVIENGIENAVARALVLLASAVSRNRAGHFLMNLLLQFNLCNERSNVFNL